MNTSGTLLCLSQAAYANHWVIATISATGKEGQIRSEPHADTPTGRRVFVGLNYAFLHGFPRKLGRNDIIRWTQRWSAAATWYAPAGC
jgi:hypothetical protein